MATTPRGANTARARVWQAGVRLFAARGFHGTGIRDLAVEAGLSSASLYHYMGSKEDLLVDIMMESLQRLLATGRELIDEASSPPEAIARLVQLHVVTHALLPEQTTVVDNEIRALSPTGREKVVDLRDQYEALRAGVIDDGHAQAIFTVEHPGIVRLGLLELCTGVAHWYTPEGPLSLAEVTQAHVRLASAMLGISTTGGTTPAQSVPPLEPVLSRAREVWRLEVPLPSPGTV